LKDIVRLPAPDILHKFGHSARLERSPKLDVCSGIQQLRLVSADQFGFSEAAQQRRTAERWCHIYTIGL
jgi:hypothetical protein